MSNVWVATKQVGHFQPAQKRDIKRSALEKISNLSIGNAVVYKIPLPVKTDARELGIGVVN